MPLSGYPKTLKYTAGDRPFKFSNAYLGLEIGTNGSHLNGRSTGHCQRVIVTGWTSTVRDTVGDGSGSAIQEDYYTVKDILGYVPNDVSVNLTEGTLSSGIVELYGLEYTIAGSKLFSSKNHLLGTLKGDYINAAYNGDANGGKFWVTWGVATDAFVFGPSFGDWVDHGCMDFRNAKFDVIDGVSTSIYAFVWSGTVDQTGYIGGEVGQTKTLIFDGANLTGADFPASLDTKAEFRALVGSYDADTTIWTDGNAIGHP